MSNLSEKDLLEKLSAFPRHEVTTEKRAELLKMLSEEQHLKKGRAFPLQRVAAIAAVFLLMLIAPLLYLMIVQNDSTGPSSAAKQAKDQQNEETKINEGVYFALMDDGNPVYADSNFGIPNKVSLIAPKEWVKNDSRFVAKVMVFLWGKNIELDKELKVKAVNVKSGIKEDISTAKLAGPIYGADAHTIANFQPFNRSGLWKLEFSIGEENVGEFLIEVKEPYVKMGHSTLLVSQQDIHPGFYTDTQIEVEGDDRPSTIELEVFSLENGETTNFIFKDKEEYTTTDGRRVSLYKGDFQIKNSGKYRFSVLKESQPVTIK